MRTLDIVRHLDALNAGPLLITLACDGVMADIESIAQKLDGVLGSIQGYADDADDAIYQMWANLTAVKEGDRFVALLIRQADKPERYVQWNGAAFKDVTDDFKPYAEQVAA